MAGFKAFVDEALFFVGQFQRFRGVGVAGGDLHFRQEQLPADDDQQHRIRPRQAAEHPDAEADEAGQDQR